MRLIAILLATLALTACGSSSSSDAPAPATVTVTTPATTAAPDDQALRDAAAVYGREEDGAGRIASPAAKDALAAAVADYLTRGGTIDDAARIAQAQIEETIGRTLPPGTMLGVLKTP